MTAWIEKQRYIIDFTLSSLLRRAVKNFGLLALYTLIVFILASVMFFTHSIKKEAALILQGSPEIVVQRIKAGRHDLFPVQSLEALRKIRGVASVEGRLWGYYFDGLAGANYTLMTPPAPVAERAGPGKRIAVVEEGAGGLHDGEAKRPLFEFNGVPLAPQTLLIGNGVARMRKIGQGDFMPFRAYDGTILNFRIAGTLSSQSELVSSDLMLMNEGDFRKLFGIEPEYVTDATVAVDNPSEVATVAAKISKLLPGARPIIRDEILRTYDSIFN